MSELQFKTNIKCSACVEKVTPVLNELAGEGQWQVNLQVPERLLTINGETNPGQVSEALEKAGYAAERI